MLLFKYSIFHILESILVEEAILSIRTRAVSLIEAGMLIHEVANVVDVSVRTIRRWLLRSEAGVSTEQEGLWKETSVTMIS